MSEMKEGTRQAKVAADLIPYLFTAGSKILTPAGDLEIEITEGIEVGSKCWNVSWEYPDTVIFWFDAEEDGEADVVFKKRKVKDPR